YDGNPEADDDVAASIAARKAELAEQRKLLTIPADPSATSQLVEHYVSDALGEIDVVTDGKSTTFDFGGGWKSPMGSRKNDDGTFSMVTIATGNIGDTFVLGEKNGKKTLTIRDAQHEYVFVESVKKK